MTVFILFDADGYECKSFVGAYSTQQNADVAAIELRNRAAAEWAEMLNQCDPGSKRKDSRRITIEEVPVESFPGPPMTRRVKEIRYMEEDLRQPSPFRYVESVASDNTCLPDARDRRISELK